MRSSSLVAPVLCVLVALGSAAGAEEPAIRIIVNAANPGIGVKRAQVADIFLKRLKRWGDGTPILPVDQSVTAPVRDPFSKQFLGQSLLAVQSYWREHLAQRGDWPPPVKLSDADVAAFVKDNPGGIGYVGDAFVLPPGVKALKILD